MKLFRIRLIFLVFASVLIVSCKAAIKPEAKQPMHFISDKFGFSFYYPSGMEEVRKDLPERWAILDENKNTILFTVNKAKNANLASLGRAQALRDLYKENSTKENIEKIKQIFAIVKLDSFNNKTFYTYGIKFSDKNVSSLVSGTVCLDNEITIVMVSDSASFDDIRQKYMGILNTFGC